MKYSILLIVVVTLFTFPYSAKSQSTIKKERTDLDSLKAILGGAGKMQFMYGIEQPPTLTSTESNGATNFTIKMMADSEMNTSLCHCYCACKAVGVGLAFFRLEDMTNITLNKSKSTVSLYFHQESPDVIEVANSQTAQTVYNLFKELKTLCSQ